MKQFGAWLILGVVVGCSKAQPPTGTSTVTGSRAALSASSAPTSAPTNEAPAPAAPPPTAAVASSAPTSFKGGVKESIGDAVGLGCEPTSLDGWLQLLCRKKNGTGGHPVRAVIPWQSGRGT
jgi:hypothetical protein